MTREDIKILVVDDEEWILSIFQNALEESGYLVDCALDGYIALEMCEETTYHIVITDLVMPSLDGLSLLKRIKARWPTTEVIVVTGYATIKAAIEALKEGASDFILKPVNFDQIRFTINKCYQKIKALTENQELRTLNHRLRELNEMKDKFLSITNHELRTPVTIIKGYLEILDASLTNKDREVEEILSILMKTTMEMLETIDRLHILSRMQHGKWEFQLGMINPVEVLEKIIERMKPLYNHRKVTLEMLPVHREVKVLGNVSGLRLIFHELLHNALKFTPDGGRVVVRLYHQTDQVVFEIADTGVGIPYEKQELIFKDFYEVQDSINHSSSREEFMGGGMGIGLSLVKELVLSLNGKIEVDSEPEVGSTFRVYFPTVQSNMENYHEVDLLSF